MGESCAYCKWHSELGNCIISNKINYTCKNLPANSPNKHRIVIAKGDSGATHHYICPQDKAYLKDRKPNSTITVTLPNAQAISSTIQGNLSLH